MRTFHRILSVFCLTAATLSSVGAETPNIIFILADDMGIGDVSHTTGKAATPHIDRLAAEGMRFTDAHSASSVCTPTRYALLTGRYAWRTRLKKGVFMSPHEAPLIGHQEVTVASLLHENGYHTACIGKWHLGIGWQFYPDFHPQPGKEKEFGWDIDYSKAAVTPTSCGFDYFWGIQASLDMAPYVYIENELATQPGTVTKAFHRRGAAAVDFEAVHCLRDFAKKSVAYIDARAQQKKPFFLYLPLTAPHTPIVPSPAWQGKSSLGKYGDFLMETDWVVGQVLAAIDRHTLSDNTIVIFSTDNGCSPAAGIPKLIEQGHVPNGELRGHKADIFEGGHRVPFVVRWPGVVMPGSETKRLTCQTDVIRTCADLVGIELPDSAGVDSVSFLATLHDSSEVERDAIVHHSINGSFAIRKGKWKLCLCPGSGGWSDPRPGNSPADAPPVQLFDLSVDRDESHNLALQHPDRVEELTALLRSYVDEGRSTAGPKQTNVGEISLQPAS